MRLDILTESAESLLEDGEGATAASLGDATAASTVGPVGTPTPGVNTTADVAMHPQYLGFSFRGGTLRMKNRKRKSLHEEALNSQIGSLLEEYSKRLSKVPQLEQIEED